MNPEAHLSKDIMPASPDKPKNATTDWGRDFVSINLLDVSNVISTVGITRPTGDREYALREAEAKARGKGEAVLVYQLAGVYESRNIPVDLPFAVGQSYTTRAGSTVKLVHQQPSGGPYRFVGLLLEKNGDCDGDVYTFTEAGKFNADRNASLDLIPKTRTERKFGFWPAERTA